MRISGAVTTMPGGVGIFAGSNWNAVGVAHASAQLLV
jgi:hypothetical protein